MGLAIRIGPESGSLLGENKLLLAGDAQAVLLPEVMDANLACASEQGAALDHPHAADDSRLIGLLRSGLRASAFRIG